MSSSCQVHHCENCPYREKSIFAHLPKEVLLEVDKIRKEMSFESGQELPNKTQGFNGFYCLQSGHARVDLKHEQRSHAIRIVGPGELIGYGDWLTHHEHKGVALDSVKACFFKAQDFQKLMQKTPQLSDNVIKTLCDIIYAKGQRISGLENHSVRNRVCALLNKLATKFGEIQKNGVKINVAVDRKTLAEMSGTVVESLARTLTQLEEENVIQREGRALVVVNQQKLLDYSLN